MRTGRKYLLPQKWALQYNDGFHLFIDLFSPIHYDLFSPIHYDLFSPIHYDLFFRGLPKIKLYSSERGLKIPSFSKIR